MGEKPAEVDLPGGEDGMLESLGLSVGGSVAFWELSAFIIWREQIGGITASN